MSTKLFLDILFHRYLNSKKRRILYIFGVLAFIFMIIVINYDLRREAELRNNIFRNSIHGNVVEVLSGTNEFKFKVENDYNVYYLMRNTSNSNYTPKYISNYLKIGSFIDKNSMTNILTLNDSLIFRINENIEVQ